MADYKWPAADKRALIGKRISRLSQGIDIWNEHFESFTLRYGMAHVLKLTLRKLQIFLPKVFVARPCKPYCLMGFPFRWHSQGRI